MKCITIFSAIMILGSLSLVETGDVSWVKAIAQAVLWGLIAYISYKTEGRKDAKK